MNQDHLPGIEVATKPLPGRIVRMHTRYNRLKGRLCGDCLHFVLRTRGGGTYNKCDAFGRTATSTSDWKGEWPACRLWKEKE